MASHGCKASSHSEPPWHHDWLLTSADQLWGRKWLHDQLGSKKAMHLSNTKAGFQPWMIGSEAETGHMISWRAVIGQLIGLQEVACCLDGRSTKLAYPSPHNLNRLHPPHSENGQSGQSYVLVWWRDMRKIFCAWWSKQKWSKGFLKDCSCITLACMHNSVMLMTYHSVHMPNSCTALLTQGKRRQISSVLL